MSELNNLVFKILGSHLKGEYKYKYVNSTKENLVLNHLHLTYQ